MGRAGPCPLTAGHGVEGRQGQEEAQGRKTRKEDRRDGKKVHVWRDTEIERRGHRRGQAGRQNKSCQFPRHPLLQVTTPAPRPRDQVSLFQTSPAPRLLPPMSRPGVPAPVTHTCTHVHRPAQPDTSTSARLSPERTTCPPASLSRVQLRPSQLITHPVFHLQPPQIHTHRHRPAPKSHLSHLS